MPESRKREKAAYTPPPRAKKDPVKIGNPVWFVPLMVAMFIIGLLWIVVWYIAPENVLMAALGAWNVVVGFAFIGVGFVLATRWH